MSQVDFRCEGDLDLFTRLMDDREVQKANRELEENSRGGVRRQLLATALRLTESMSPRLSRMLESARKQLGITIPVESYVYNSPQFNAACIKQEDGLLLLMFSSSLLEKFDERELLFVMGHELGHHMFDHTAIPIGYLVKGPDRVGAQLALQLFAWSRYAEISADRAGAMCAKDPDATARALFKLASGLTTDLIEIRIDEFAAQADEMDLERKSGLDDGTEQDWFLTHPFTPLRVKALQLFFQSDVILSDGGMTKTQLESETHTLMEMMAPTYLQEKSPVAETMRRVLFAAGCGVMAASGKVTDNEIAAFEKLFGDGAFGANLNLDSLEEALDARIADAVKSVSIGRRLHIVRDLCMIARVGGVTKKERAYIESVSDRLDLAEDTVAECLNESIELD